MGETREIYHFHYTTWPDFGVPESPASFLHFLFNVRESGSLDAEHGPSVVHCSAGIGRSGTLALVDTCLVLVRGYFSKMMKKKPLAAYFLAKTFESQHDGCIRCWWWGVKRDKFLHVDKLGYESITQKHNDKASGISSSVHALTRAGTSQFTGSMHIEYHMYMCMLYWYLAGTCVPVYQTREWFELTTSIHMNVFSAY